MNELILAFAVARIARLVVTDDITRPLREWFLTRWPSPDTVFGDSEVESGKLKTGQPVFRTNEGWVATNPHYWSQLVECVWCSAVWVAIIVWAGYLLYPDLVLWLTPLALAQAASMIHDY